MDGYVRQEARVIRNSCHSAYFRLKNGVKQGGVLSPTLFNVYIDRLLVTLKNSGIGCHIMVHIWGHCHILMILLCVVQVCMVWIK